MKQAVASCTTCPYKPACKQCATCYIYADPAGGLHVCRRKPPVQTTTTVVAS